MQEYNEFRPVEDQIRDVIKGYADRNSKAKTLPAGVPPEVTNEIKAFLSPDDQKKWDKEIGRIYSDFYDIHIGLN